ncbi:MAG: cytochrome P450 [Actinomycetota bacterium]
MSTDPVMFNPLQPGFMENPFVHYAEVRSATPVQPILDRWAVFSYADCFEMLRDPSMSVEDENSDILDTERSAQADAIAASLGVEVTRDQSMLNTDPPDHTRLRRLVSKAFTPRSIEELRPVVQRLVDQQLDQVAADGGGDVVDALAFPLPFDVISEMLGMPETDKEEIKIWSGHMVRTLDPIVSDEELRLAFESGIHMDAHINKVIEWKRDNPGDDLLTRMIEAEEDGDRLSTEELNAQITLLFIAGHETTVNLIGTGFYELMRNPEQLEVWREDPDVAANAVDELLRYVSPVQMSRRIALKDIEFQGVQIPERAFVMAVLASANHDPDKFGADADQLDLRRPTAGQHVSFGSGAHYCLGASLAKLEAQVALGSLVERFGHATLAGDPVWNGRLNLRGLEHLPVSV